MAGSPHSFWILTTAFLCLLCGSQSLLSDYKICGDPACESLMSRVQALRDHRSDDCRFLSFRRGETIFVYYKLTGRREDLWAGTINKRFGYFPKDLVQEEQAYAVMDKVVETRKEDFFCMDEFGYPIDSSHLDNDDEQINGKMQRQGSETSTSATDGLKVGSILRSTDPSSQSSASAKEVQEDQEKYIEDTIKETIVSSVALKNQESISSSTWSSSVTGWLGLTEEHQPSNMVEAEKGDEKKETLSQTSLPTSLTGWLRFGGERKPDSTKEMVKHEETYHSVSSTKKGHLELRSRDMDTIDKEREKQEETYRARKMSLELEGSQSNDEGKKVEQEEESRSNSWLDMGIRMLGLKKDAVRDEEKAKSGIEEIEEGKVETESQHTDITQLKPVQMTNDPIVVESKTTEPVKRKLVSSMSQTSDNNDEVEDFKGYEEKNDSIDVIRPADLAAEDHQMLKAVSNDPQEGPSVEKTGSVNGGDRDAEYSLNPNNSQTMGQNDNDEKKQDISGKTGTEESSEETPNHVNASMVQNSAEENLAGGQSHVSFFFGKDGLIQDEPKNYTSNTTEDINDYVGIDTTPKILDQEDLTKPVQSSSEESEVMKMGSKVSEEQEMIHLEEEEIRNLRETDEILEEKPPGKTELKNESEERKLDVMEIEGMEVKKKQKEVQKFHEKEKLANLSEEETEEEIKEGLKLKKKAETVEIKEERRPIELEKIQEKDTGVKGKQVYKDLDTPELGSAPQQKIILETLSAENAEDKKQGKDINPDEMKEKETETVNQAESKNVENNSQVCSHGICPNSSKVGPEEDGNKGTVKGGGSQSTEILSEEKDLPSRINEKIRVHPGNEENTPSLKEGILESHDLDSEVQKEGRGSLGEGTWNLVTVTKDSQISSAESSRTPNDPSRDRSTSGTFGFLKNAMGLFSQTLNTEPKDSPKVQQLVVKPSEAPLMEASGTTEKDLDSTINSSPNQLTDPDSPKTQPQLHPLSGDTSMDEATQSLENLIQIQDLSKSYPNILVHVSLVDITVMLEKLGPHKLMSLELILTDLNDPDHDLSVVLDMERLLQNHIETLLVPSLGVDGTLSEDKEKTKTLIALQKMEMLLKEIRKTFNMGHVDLQDHTDEVKWVDPSCSSNMNSIEGYNDGDLSGTDDYPEAHEDNKHQKGWMSLDKEQSPVDIVTEAHSVSEEVKAGSSSGQRASLPHIEQLSKEVKHKTFSFLDQWAEGLATRTLKILELLWLTEHVVSALPEDLRPGPDVFGMPWEPVIVACVVGLLTIFLFTCRCYSSLKSRMYRSKEQWMSEQIVQLLDEKCKVLETLSQCQQEYDELQSSLEDSGADAQTRKAEQLEVKAGHLENAKNELETDVFQLKDLLDQQRDCRMEQEARIAVLEQSMKTFEEEIKDLQSQDEQAQTTLKVYSMNSERLQRNLDTAGGENAVLQETNAHLRQQVEGWAERVSELEAEIRRCELAHSGMMQDVATKDQRITSLTDRLLQMKAWDSDVEEEEAGEGEKKKGADRPDGHLQKVQKLIYAAKLNADLKSVDEDKDRVFAKLNDEVKAKEDLQEAIKEMESEKLSLQSEAENYTAEVQRLQQKLQIMTEMYQENELKLHRLLTVEEKERLQKEEKLNKADKNIALAMEELNNYRQRAGEMEEELDKTKQSYQTQISAHEKKAHNNWLAARAADRELADIRRENALIRQKLTDTQFKLDALDKDPYALGSLAHPLPFRGERSPYGRPASETRGFLSPPTLMDAPPPRLSPRVPRGPGEPLGGQSELERSGGPHSDSGSSSPTWEKDRRGPLPGSIPGPPGYMFTDPGAPMFRRPPPPGRGFPPAPPHPSGMADELYRESVRAAEEHGPEAEPRMGGAPPMGPTDAPFPRRAAYRPPPPPDFFPPRGPGGPPMIPVWALPPSGMMPPLRFPPPHMPPMRLPPPSMAPPSFRQSFPPPPHNQPPQDATATAEDSI